jgi:hypothetical protein
MIEELSDQFVSVPEPGNLTSYLPLDATTKDKLVFRQAVRWQECI